jgi:ribosomal protein L29
VADLNKYLGGGGKTVKLHDQRERLREADEAELRDVLSDLQGEMFNLHTQAMMQQLPNPLRIRHTRKLAARIQTELSTRRRKTA